MKAKIKFSLKTPDLNKLKFHVAIYFFSFLLTHSILAQPVFEWKQNFGGSSFDGRENTTDTKMEVISTNNGYLIAGKSRSDDEHLVFTDGVKGDFDWWLVKTDILGNLEWERNYGGSSDDRLTQIIPANDDGFILGGWSISNDGDFDANLGFADRWLVKIDNSGEIVWKQNYGISTSDYVYALESSHEGGYIFGGDIASSEGLTLINQNGFIINEGDYYSMVGIGTIQSIHLTNDGGYIIGVRTYNEDSTYDYQAIKITGNLVYEWHAEFGGSLRDWFKVAKQTPDNGYVLAGWTESTDGDVSGNQEKAVWVVKINAQGQMEWEKSYGRLFENESLEDCTITNEGILLACTKSSNFWIIQTDFEGNIIWDTTYDFDNDILYSIKQTNNNEFILAGASKTNGGASSENNFGEYDYCLVKLKNPNQTGIFSDVYPGDLNHDGVVNNQDVGISGLHLFQSGITRASEHQNIDWYPHPAEDWDILQFNGKDIKHHDCNGDGVIDEDDQQAIQDNMGLSWQPVNPPPSPPVSDYLVLLNPIDQIIDGYVIMNIVLERRANDDLDLQGGHFTIDYSDIPGNISFVTLGFFDESWLGNRDVNLWFQTNDFPIEQKIEVGFTKTDNANSSGSGAIGQLILAFDNNASKQAVNSNISYNFGVYTIGVHQNNGDFIPIEDQQLEIIINPNICHSNLTIDEDAPFQNVYQSSNTITTNGLVLIGEDQEIEYNANRVRINSSFSVKAGAEFKVRSSGCN